MTRAVKITRKGQVTIPKEIRDRLKATAVFFDVVNGEVVLRAVKDAAGSLSEFAGNAQQGISIRETKEKAWEEAVREKVGHKSS